MTPQTQKITNLATAGVTFTLLRWKEKRPIYENWPNLRYGADVASKHVAKGGNLGAHLGRQPDGTFLDAFDADYGPAMSKLLAIAPELRQSLAVWREGGSSKIIFRTDAPLGRQQTPDLAGEHTKLELIVSGQAAIFGAHPAGDAYHCNWKPPISLTPERVKEIWLQWTGQPWDTSAGGHNHEDAGPPDAEAVQNSMTLVETVLTLAGVPVPSWRVYNGDGRKVVLDKCPFNPIDDPHAEDRSAAVVIGADGRIGSTCHHARCQARIQQHGGGGWALLKDIAGYKPDPPPPRIDPAELDAMRAIVKTIDPDDFMIGRTAPTLRIQNAALAVLRIAQLSGRYTDLALGVRRVAEISGTSKSTAARVLPHLAGWFIVAAEGSDEDEQGRPLRWSIAPSILAAAREKIEVDQLCQNGTVVDLIVDPKPQDNNVSHFGTVDLRTAFMAHDAFIARQLPMKESEFKAKEAEREAEIAHTRAVVAAMAADGVPAEELPKIPGRLKRKRYIRRLRATVASPGPGVLVVVDLLHDKGPMGRQALADEAQVSRRSLYRTIAAGVEAGVLEYSGGIVSLTPDWQQQLAQETPKMPTAGVMLQRKIDNAGARLGWLKSRRSRATTDAERAALDKQIARVAAKRQKLMARQAGRDVGPGVAAAALTNARFDGDTLTTASQVITAQKPRRRMTADEWRARQLAMMLEEDASATWARQNAVRSAETAPGWWMNFDEADILMDFSSFAASGYGV